MELTPPMRYAIRAATAASRSGLTPINPLRYIPEGVALTMEQRAVVLAEHAKRLAGDEAAAERFTVATM